jgi:hypothetical protein
VLSCLGTGLAMDATVSEVILNRKRPEGIIRYG